MSVEEMEHRKQLAVLIDPVQDSWNLLDGIQFSRSSFPGRKNLHREKDVFDRLLLK